MSAVLNLQQYTFNPYSIAPLLVGTIILILGLFLSRLEKGSNFNRSLFYFCVSSVVWLYSCVLILNSKSGNVALFWSHSLCMAFVITPATLLHLSTTLQKKFDQQRYLVLGGYTIAGTLFVLNKFMYFIEGVKKYYFGYYPEIGFLQPANVTFFAVCILVSIINLVIHLLTIKDQEEKTRTKIFIFCFVIVSFSMIDIFAAQGTYMYPSGFIAFLGFIIGITCFKMMFYTSQIKRYTENLEEEVALKTREVTQAMEELRTTQMKLLETGKRSALASLSAGILHQLSQPITAIHGFARFIKGEMKTSHKFYRPIALIDEESTEIKHMLEDLMSLARHRKIEKEYIDINDTISKAIHLLTDELRMKRVAWDTELDLNLPPVYGDNVHLQQIFINIINGALLSMEELPKGKRRYLRISSSICGDGKDVCIIFEDSGEGMSASDKEVVIEPFFDVKSKGVSMELSLCKDLIAEHGGTIDVEAKEQGTRFIIKLPTAQTVKTSK